MKKLFFILLFGFVFSLSFANTFEDDVGDKDGIEYNQNFDVMTATLNIVETPSFSNQLFSDEKPGEVIVLFNDSSIVETVNYFIIKLPDIKTNMVLNKNNIQLYYNSKFEAIGVLPYT